MHALIVGGSVPVKGKGSEVGRFGKCNQSHPGALSPQWIRGNVIVPTSQCPTGRIILDPPITVTISTAHHFGTPRVKGISPECEKNGPPQSA